MTTENKSAEIEKLSHDGRGVARVNGKTLFIFGALPGEIVDYRIVRRHKSYDEAIAEKIEQPSAKRVAAECPHFGTCGGCMLQHLSSEEQLRFKQTVLLEQLQHSADTKPEKLLPELASQAFGYRSRARLSVRYVRKKQKVLIGFHEIDGRFVADIARCPVLHPAIGERISQLSSILQQISSATAIVQLEVAMSETEQALVFRHKEILTAADRKLLADFGQDNGFAIYLQGNKPAELEKIHGAVETQLRYSLAEFKLDYLFEPQDFVQVNADINRRMIIQAIQLLALSRQDSIIDFFSGIGNFSLPLARLAGQVLGIEGEQKLVAKAEQNAALNQLSNVVFEKMDLYDDNKLDGLRERLKPLNYNKILLDPPRSGAASLIPILAELKPEKILYVSCNPATLARDTGLLKNHGYVLNDLGIVDMFPQTKHVEAMALFLPKR